jgi:glycosyltransferase involved in cell wall biosynthesis
LKILSITAGAAGMYCGSCLLDNALAAEMLSRGHDVTLLPLYTPTLTDEPNVSRPRVLFGGINVYLQQTLPWTWRLPRFVHRWLDSPWLIQALASRSVSTDPRFLGDMTISMLEGTDGVLRGEFDKLIEWMAGEPKPDLISLPNSMLIALARPIREAFGRPVTCTLQGEDLFLQGLTEPYRSRALGLIRKQVADVDRFVAVSAYCARFMSEYVGIPADRITVVPIGINPAGLSPRAPRTAPPSSDEVFRIGYFARVAPEKGLLPLAEAYIRFRQRSQDGRARLEAAGYLAAEHEPYLNHVRQTLDRAGLAGEFAYHGAVDRQGKADFFRSLDVLSVPATYDEPKGLSLLEAMAVGVPVVQPRRGAFTEIVESTGGGLLVTPDDPDALAEGLLTLWSDRGLADRLGRQGCAGVRGSYTVQHSATSLLDLYARLTS